MNVKQWSAVPKTEVKELFLNNPYPLYRNTPLGNESMKEFMFEVAQESAKENIGNAFVIMEGMKPIAAGQVYSIPYLSDFWGMATGGIGHIATDMRLYERPHSAVDILVDELVKSAKQKGIKFLSSTVPGPNIYLAQALEKNGFYYAEGFINMVGTTNEFRERFEVPGLKIREAIEDDFSEIQDAYSKVNFPSRFVTDPGFDASKAKLLYSKRFKEVYEQRIGRVFVAELDNIFAGAIIAIIDEKISKNIGVKTNILSGMGIIIHPRFSRRGVASSLIEYRQAYYKSQGVEYVSFGANFNNRPMILGLLKLGLTYGSLDVTFHNWL